MKVTATRPVELDVKIMEVDAGVRYWNDARVNGVPDTDCEETDGEPTIPCAVRVSETQQTVLRGEMWRWRPTIEIETGRILNWTQGVRASIHYKVCDDFRCEILDIDGAVVQEYHDYVPGIMYPADDGFGDYIIMGVDENGMIEGWNPSLINRLFETEDD